MAQQPQNDRPPVADEHAQGDVLAFTLAVPWVLITGTIFWLAWPDPEIDGGFSAVRVLLVLIAVFAPAGFIFAALASALAVKELRKEQVWMRVELGRIADQQAAQSAMVRTHIAQLAALAEPAAAAQPAQPAQPAPADPVPQDSPPAQPVAPEPPVSGFASRREVSRLIVPRAAPQAPADQPALALETPKETAPPIATPDLIKALNFPDDENDTEGFAALRRALRDRGARKLVQASQDVLTLLSQDGIYMDDLRPEPAGADLWRRFASGERGRTVGRLGGIKDQAYLSVISRRTREDAIFRDSVHHFLRRFDQLLVSFVETATDTDLLALGETRTARAFMLLGRATGIFD